MSDNILTWLQSWYDSQCNGEWEHQYGITIQTIDNPGWDVEIDLSETKLDGIRQEWKLLKIDENNWYGFKIENNKFIASGDTSKLYKLLNLFKELFETDE